MKRILFVLVCLTVVVVGYELLRNRSTKSATLLDAKTTPVIVLPIALPVASMDADPEAKALLAKLQAMKASPAAPRDDFNSPGERRLTGPVTIQDGAACFPEDRSEAIHIYYGTVLPKRGRLSLDFRVDRMPRDHNFMTLCETGTGGNTKFMMRLRMDRRVTVNVMTRRQSIQVLSEPVAPGKWHQLRWWYAPEGSVLQIDGVIQDYATDYCVPYAVEVGDAFYLGDQPWWDNGGRRVIFYPLDSFVGFIDNLCLESLQQ